MKIDWRFFPSLCAAGILEASGVFAQNMSFGADNFYVSSNVTVENITFPSQFQTAIVGSLFYPNNIDVNASNAAIIVGHPMGAVRQQAANLYATKMAEQGFVAVTLDLPFWGASEGQPRHSVSPDLYADAFSAAIDWIHTQPMIDRTRIGGLGICGSGSFIISAAKIDPRFRAIATSSMYDMGAVNRDGLMNAQNLSQRLDVIAQASQQRSIEAEGGEPVYTGGTPISVSEIETAVDEEFFDFYRTPRGEYIPEDLPEGVITTQPTLSSVSKFMNFYPFNDIETISPRPMLFVTGTNAHSREFSQDAYYLAREPKELYWVPGAGHADLYDRTELIPFAKFTEFFSTSLAATS